jgi:peptidoglycan/LPS O-acetylase OafA/YrhL
MILLSIPLIWLYKESGYLSYLSLSITRIPIFLLGVLFFKDTEQNKCHLFLTTCVILWLYIFAFSFFWKVPGVIQDGPLLPILMGLLGFIISLKYLRFIEVFLSFVGTISLEFYLIHPFRRPQYLLSYITKNSELQVLGAFILCLILAYILHVLMQKVNEKYLFPKHR